VDNIQLGQEEVQDTEVEIGGMDYGFEINGILGMDILLEIGAIIHLQDLKLVFK
jgi:hypothetical protein